MSENLDKAQDDRRTALIDDLESASIGSTAGAAAGAVISSIVLGNLVMPVAGAALGALAGAAWSRYHHDRKSTPKAAE